MNARGRPWRRVCVCFEKKKKRKCELWRSEKESWGCSTRWHCCVVDSITPPALHPLLLSSLFLGLCFYLMLSLPPLLFHLPLFLPLSTRRMYDGAGYTTGNWTRRSVRFPESKQGAWKRERERERKKKEGKLYPRTVSVCLIDCHPHTDSLSLSHTHTHTHTRTHTYSCSQFLRTHRNMREYSGARL